MKLTLSSIRLRLPLFLVRSVLVFVILRIVGAYVPFVWQFFDLETAMTIRDYLDYHQTVVDVIIGALSLIFSFTLELIDYKKQKDREELRKVDPEKARELDVMELENAIMPLFKEAKREHEKAKKKETFYNSLPEPVRDFRDATNNFFNGPVPKHHEKTVIIVAIIIFVILAAVAYFSAFGF
ncbi:hypothetical protein IKG31_01300 [Candidatus Saccharibacteria bacterium]|nr:hypothetical protein [Candidatus Saccharibacteria bacterium]